MPPVDFLIITALAEERDAVLSKFGNPEPLPKDGLDVHTYHLADVRTARGTSYRVIVTALVQMGPIEAAAQTAFAIGRWQPEAVLMVGIAGGVKGVAALGDVLIARQVADYTLGKVETPTTKKARRSAGVRATPRRAAPRRQIRWESHRVDRSLLDSALHLPAHWRKLIRVRRPERGQSALRDGIVASGGDVVADKSFMDQLRVNMPKLVGVEMEGGGVATAIKASVREPRFLMIRGVSDFADPHKNAAAAKKWRRYAAHAAAAFARALLVSGPLATVHRAVPSDETVTQAALATASGRPTPGPSTVSLPTASSLRSRDTRTLKELLSTIDVTQVDLLIDRAYVHAIPHAMFHYLEGFRAAYTRTDFHLYDETLAPLVRHFADALFSLFSFSDYFVPTSSGKEYRFVSFGHVPEVERQRALKAFDGAVANAEGAFKALLQHVKESWQEIDLSETSGAARRDRVDFDRRMDEMFAGVLDDDSAKVNEQDVSPRRVPS